MNRLITAFLLLFSFSVQIASAQDESHNLKTVPLVPGSEFSDSLASNSIHRYNIDLPAGQFVYGEADQQSVDVVVTVYGPDGRTVGRFDNPARGPEPFQIESKVAGTYRIEVTPFEGGEGRYVMALRRLEPLAGSPQEKVHQFMATYDGSEKPGGVVAVVRNGEIIFAQGYGMANLEYEIPNTPETPYHMASVSKQFTAFAIVMLAEQGKLSLDDDVRKHIPEFPDLGKTITLRHLLNHTSGLRDQWNLWVMSGGRMDDVIRQEDLLSLVIRQRELNFEPGAEFLYSNTGYMLLAEVVKRVTGTAFGVWMREQVFKPLGMHATQIYDDHERIVKGRAYSYQSGEGGFKKAVLSYANSGATSLFTTAVDLALWLRNFHTANVGGFQVIERLQERGILNKGDTLNYALGISIDRYRGLKRIQHGGADAGYRTMLVYYPDIDAGVIVLGNAAAFNAGQIANQVTEAFFGDVMAEEEVPQERVVEAGVPVAPELLDTYAGVYVLEGGPTVTFTRVNDRLVSQVEGMPGSVLTALSDTLFRIDAPGVDARVSFQINPDGQVERGTVYMGEKIPMRRSVPWNPVAGDLESYVGRYYSPELETFYTVDVKDKQLVVRVRRHGDVALSPVEKDVFKGAEWYLGDAKFERDASGRVIGMMLSNGRIRNLRFERQE